jgi:hypothetical protein
MPPLATKSFALFSFSAFSLRRFSGLKFSNIEGFSPSGRGFLLPKKSAGVGSPDKGLAMAFDLGLEAALVAPVGLKVFAAGLGLKSGALTLNLAETADVGVRTALGGFEPGIGVAFTDGLLGGF